MTTKEEMDCLPASRSFEIASRHVTTYERLSQAPNIHSYRRTPDLHNASTCLLPFPTRAPQPAAVSIIPEHGRLQPAHVITITITITTAHRAHQRGFRDLY